MRGTYVVTFSSGLLYYTDGLQDDVLGNAIAKADAEVEKMKQEADAKKWRMVADKMKVMKVNSLPSTK